MSTAVKRTSLKGESFWKRVVLGGNFNVSKTNPLNIDLSPVLGYRINKLSEIGITGAYRTRFSTNKYSVVQNEQVYGYSIFASHMIFKSFFGYLEGERMLKSGTTNEIKQSSWNQTLLVGIGKKFKVTAWLEMQTMVMVNLLHDNKDGLYTSPVIFKTGLRMKK